jgi:hypothetical protein
MATTKQLFSYPGCCISTEFLLQMSAEKRREKFNLSPTLAIFLADASEFSKIHKHERDVLYTYAGTQGLKQWVVFYDL